MNVLMMHIPGDPISQPRPRVAVRGKHGVAYVPRQHKIHQWRAKIRSRLELAVSESKQLFPVSGIGLRVMMEFNMRKPKSNKTVRPIGRPDLDNLAKAVLDAGNGVVWRDDSQVTQVLMSKRWDICPGLWLTICEDTP